MKQQTIYLVIFLALIENGGSLDQAYVDSFSEEILVRVLESDTNHGWCSVGVAQL